LLNHIIHIPHISFALSLSLKAAAFAKKKAMLDGTEPAEATPVPRKMAPAKYKKAPDAPKRFKSAFIIFSAEKHKEIKEDLTKQGRAEKVRSFSTNG
jgi:hypothetical protein